MEIKLINGVEFPLHPMYFISVMAKRITGLFINLYHYIKRGDKSLPVFFTSLSMHAKDSLFIEYSCTEIDGRSFIVNDYTHFGEFQTNDC